jgi:hypothetical protein
MHPHTQRTLRKDLVYTLIYPTASKWQRRYIYTDKRKEKKGKKKPKSVFVKGKKKK